MNVISKKVLGKIVMKEAAMKKNILFENHYLISFNSFISID
jgi:hypothetical protein